MSYNFVHYINTNNYNIDFNNNKYSVFYNQISKDFKEYINNKNIIIESNNLKIQHNIGENILNSIFEIKNKIEKIKISFILSSDFRLEKDSNSSIILFKNNEKIINFYSSILTDSVGNYSPENQIEISQDPTYWNININLDDEWISNPNTIYPLRYQFDTVFSAEIQVNASNIQMLSSGTDQVYSDVREESATQFYITFYDDSQFKRPKAVYQGLPVCSTVPYAVGDTYNLTENEIQQWYDGLGDDERDVYLQIISSKVIDANKQVYYDVYLPGTIDYRSQIAEFVDFYSGSPVYRGSFKIHKNKAPSYIDGIGYVNVYLNESKYTDIVARMTVLGVDRSMLYGSFTLGTYGPWSNISQITSTMDVSSLGYGVSILESTMDVVLGAGEGVSVLPGIIEVDLPTSYGAKIISGKMDVTELGRKFLSGIMSVTSNYGINALNATMDVEGTSSDITPIWYDSKNFKAYNTSDWSSGDQIKHKDDYVAADSVSFSDISSSSRYLAAALDVEGNVWCWGRKNLCGIGAESQDISLQRSPIQVSTTEVFSDIYSHVNTVARNSAGELWYWGHHSIQNYGDFNASSVEFFSTPTLISGTGNYDYFVSDYWGVVAQDAHGDVYRFGDGGSLLDPAVLDSDFSGLTFIQMVAGEFFVAGLDAGGAVWFAGGYGYPPTFINDIHPAEMISGAHTFIKIAAGTSHLLGLKADGSVWGWGAYGFGQLGLQYYTGNFYDFTTYNTAIEVNSGLNISDISAGQFTSLFLDASGKLYSTGISGYVNRNNFGADAELGYYDISSSSYSEVSGNKKWIKINAGDDACIAIADDSKLYSWGAGALSTTFDSLGQGKIAYRGKTSPGKVKFFDQDLWGGFVEDTISTGLGTLQLPRLSTKIHKSGGNVIVRPDYDDLVTASYLADKMNASSAWSSYSVWADYYKYMAENIFEEDVYNNFKYLHMMMYSDSDTYSNFKQKGQFMKPLYQMSSSLANGIQYHFADLTNGINIEIDYINRSLTSILSPFDKSYSLYGLNWSEVYSESQAAVYAEVKVRDVSVAGSIKDYTTNSGLVNLSSNTNKVILQMAGLGSGSYDTTGSGGETYPVSVKLIFQPSMRLYTLEDLDSYDETIYGTYHFVAPTTSVEISNIKIYPRRNIEI